MTGGIDWGLAVAGLIAVTITGLSKGGFGGAFGLFAVPILSLAVSPVAAAAIMLPILCAMDAIAVWSWWGFRDDRLFRLMLPAAVIGILAGWLLAAAVSADHVRLVVGLLGLAFAGRYYLGGPPPPPRPHRTGPAAVLGFGAGFASFVAHAGGPPFQIYALPLRLDREVYVGSTTLFFAILNAIKLVPYFALGQFTGENLTTSALLLPVALLSTIVGVRLLRHIPTALFYRLSYAILLPVSLKLVWDGAAALL